MLTLFCHFVTLYHVVHCIYIYPILYTYMYTTIPLTAVNSDIRQNRHPPFEQGSTVLLNMMQFFTNTKVSKLRHMPFLTKII